MYESPHKYAVQTYFIQIVVIYLRLKIWPKLQNMHIVHVGGSKEVLFS